MLTAVDRVAPFVKERGGWCVRDAPYAYLQTCTPCPSRRPRFVNTREQHGGVSLGHGTLLPWRDFRRTDGYAFR